MSGFPRLPDPPVSYSQRDQAEFRRALTGYLSGVEGFASTTPAGTSYTKAEADALLAAKATLATTLAGYGITDAYTKTAADALLAAKAAIATTLAGYGITDAYTKTAADALLAAKAPLASPTFTGVPAAPTASVGTNTTQLATTAFVLANLPSVPVSSVFGRTGAVVAALGDYDASKINPGTFPTGNYQVNGVLTVNAGRIVMTGNTGSNVPFYVNQAIVGGGFNFAYGLLIEPVGDSGVTSILNGVAVLCHTSAAAYTVQDVRSFRIFDAAKGAGSSVTTQYGLIIDDLAAGATNYSIYTGAGIVHLGGRVELIASVAANAPLRIPHGTAPTSPVNGDMWTTTAGLFVRINGATVGPLT